MPTSRTRIGVLGCGMVSHMYLPNLERSPVIEVAAVADVDAETASGVAARYGIASATPEQLLADESIGIIVNLTPIAAHASTTLAALRAGKHVYSEKVLAPTRREAAQLVEEATRLGLRLACAPDTMLGSSFGAARSAIDASAIGRPLFASAVMVRRAMTTASWYTAGMMPYLDMAPYFVSALVTLFGPATAVTAVARLWADGTDPVASPAGAPLALDGVIAFAGGATATLSLAWGIEGYEEEVTRLDVYGSTGIAHLSNPNLHSEAAFVEPYGETLRPIERSHRSERRQYNLRGIGVADFAQAIAEGRPHRADARTAAHVVEIIESVGVAARSGVTVPLTSTMSRPAPITEHERARLAGAP